MCTRAIIMCYHRLPQRAVKDNHLFLLLINIISEKNPHACFLKSTFTKREQFRTKRHCLQSWFFLEKNISVCRVERRACPLSLLHHRGNEWVFRAPSFSRCLESCSVSRSTALWGGLALDDFPVPSRVMGIRVRDEQRQWEKGEWDYMSWTWPRVWSNGDSERRQLLFKGLEFLNGI